MKKKLFLTVLTILLPFVSFAQFSPAIQAYYDFGVDKFKNKFYGANVILNYSFYKQFKAGIGVGIGGADMLYYELNSSDSRDDATLMPVFADAQYRLVKDGISPYVNLDAGYTFAISSNIDNPGFFILPAFGVSFPLKKGAINLQVGYKYQKFQYDWFWFSSSNLHNLRYDSASGTEKTSCNEIQIAVSYSF